MSIHMSIYKTMNVLYLLYCNLQKDHSIAHIISNGFSYANTYTITIKIKKSLKIDEQMICTAFQNEIKEYSQNLP